ncbi:hypothetical protein B0T10DRAFT_608413 [Thelonectria olida]|uniref:NAD(P)-binding domain-containing protein n=1 Tax=Thelonectria olida TaxID=1576542 RepID=A0A9P8VZW0_9HYPO|nr:hypothetical protein B0T10DRAFT_608413 [Thelonectria olida]
MSDSSKLERVLVLGATGPAGICLLRELIHRKYPIVAYARNPSKIPQDISSHPLVKIVKGEISNLRALSEAMAETSVVLSLLGPNIADKKIEPDVFATQYLGSVFPLMRKFGVRRIIAMGTISISRPEDRWTMFQTMVSVFMRLFASAIYKNMQNLAIAFEKNAIDLDWTVFRIAQIPGEADEASWKADRGEETYVGPVGEKGWSSSIKRAALTKWMVDNMESEACFSKMPSLSKLAE